MFGYRVCRVGLLFGLLLAGWGVGQAQEALTRSAVLIAFENPQLSAYRVDSGGASRLIATIPQEFTVRKRVVDETVWTIESPDTVLVIHPLADSQTIYVTVESGNVDRTLGPISLRILKVLEPGSFQESYVEYARDSIESAILSPNEDYLLWKKYGQGPGTGGGIEVIDLSTMTPLGDGLVVPSNVCRAVWIDSKTILYSVDPTGTCAGVQYDRPETLWILDIETLTTQEVYGSPSWVMPIRNDNVPAVISEDLATPTMTATPQQ